MAQISWAKEMKMSRWQTAVKSVKGSGSLTKSHL
jgi:hypothetical protein